MAIDRQADGASVVLTPELIESLRAQARQGKLTDADFAAVINGLTGGSQNPAPAPAGGMTPELQEKIRLLQELRLQGVLDDGSYFAAKQKLLSGDAPAPAQTTLPRMDGTAPAPAPNPAPAPDLTGLPRMDGARVVTNTAPATNNASAPELSGLPRMDGAKPVTNAAPTPASAPDLSGLPRMDGATTVKTIPARPVPPPDLLGLPRMPGGRDVTDVPPPPPQPKPQPKSQPAPQPVKAAPPRQADVGFRLPIQDVFSIAGRGTVVVGTVAQGVIRIGDRADILFNDGRVIPTTVTAIEMFRKILEQAGAGDNVGVLLSGVKKSDVKGASVLVKHTAR